MKKFIIATHGKFAEGIYNSMEIIIGKQNNVIALCAYTDGENDIKDKVKKLLDSYSLDDEIIVITDIFGGSVNNEFMSYKERKNLYLVSGLNLTLLLGMISSQDEPVEKMILDALEEAKNGMKFCNKLWQEQEAIVEEEF